MPLSYTPKNLSIYMSAMSGAMTGMGLSGIIEDNAPSSYDNLARIAGAFAQAFDTEWGTRATSDMDLIMTRHGCEAVWTQRHPQDVSPFEVPATFTKLAKALIAMITSADNYLSAQTVVSQPSIPAVVGPNGALATGVVAGQVLTVLADGTFGFTTPVNFMPSPVDLAKSIGLQTNFAGSFTFGMLFWLVKDASLTGVRIRTQFGGGGTKNIKFRVWDPGASQLDTKTINGVASGVDLKMAFDAPVALSGTSTLQTPGRLWGVSAWYTDGSFYGPPYGTQNGFPYPAVTDGAQSIGGRGCWITPTMAFSDWVFANGDAIPSTRVAGEHYPIEPIFA